MTIQHSLRDRKRAETWSEIHRAAADMTLDKGLDAVTVDAITDQVNVSCRTFFNYFGTKEDAILGLQEPTITDFDRESFERTDDVLDGVSTLLLAVSQSTYGGEYGTSRRFEVLEAYPALLRRQLSYMGKVESLVADIVRDRLENTSWGADFAGVPQERTASIIVRVSSAAMRLALEKESHPTRAAQFESLTSTTAVFRKTLRNML